MYNLDNLEHLDQSVQDKITGDDHLPGSHINAVLDECRHLTSEAEVESAFNGYAENNRLKSSYIEAFNDNEIVGHIKSIEGFARYMAFFISQYLPDDDEVPEYRIIEKLRYLANMGTSQEKKEAELWFSEELFSKNPDYKISGNPCWIFREETEWNAKKLLSTSEASTLPCRLGLPEPKFWGGPPPAYERKLGFIGFGISKKGLIEGRRPTALDGDYDTVKKIWIPGGRTQPLPHAPSNLTVAGGLMELVCPPINFSACIGNVYVFEN